MVYYFSRSVKEFAMSEVIENTGTADSADEVGYVSLLFDFYGTLLGEHQQEIMSSYHEDDLSLAEIADNMGMTRQGVHYTLKKAERKLMEYEDRLGMVARYTENQKKLRTAEAIIQKLLATVEPDSAQAACIRELRTTLEDFAE